MKFWIELPTQLAEGEKWVQILSVGKFKHRVHGTIELTSDKLQKFVDNFKAKVRGTDLDIDYDHKMDPAKGRKAAGWIQDLKVQPSGLFGLVKWTDEAKEAIKRGEYRYLSADFYDKWTDPEGKTHNDVLAGAGLTNRPFLKNMLPVNLNELMESEEEMDPKLKKALIQRYNLSEDATDEQVQEAVVKAAPPAPPAAVDLSKAKVEWKENTATITFPDVEGSVEVKAPEPSKLSEEDEQLKKLAETNPAVAKMLSDQEETNKRLRALEVTNKTSTVTQKLNEITGLPPVVLTELRDELVKAPVEFSDKVIGAIAKLKKQGFVPEKQTSKTGSTGSEEGAGSSDAVKRFFEEVEKVKKDEANKNLSEADLYDLVAAENPQLYFDYEKAILSETTFEEVE